MTDNLNLVARYGKHIAIFTLITMSGTQCAGTSDGRLAQGQGTAIGAGAGALIGAALGGRQGALIGAAIGGASGFAYGSHIANKKAQYKSTEEWLDACISQAESKRRDAVAYNRKLDNRLAQLQREVRTASAAGDKAKLATLRREISSERSAAQKQAATFSKEAEMQRSAIKQAGGEGASRLSSLRRSTSGIETQVSIMNKGVERYAALESQTDV
ncbi:MAG: YMGG-like glycine zipper-containing protein [Verrucomicrobiota bacterium]